eukprot:CAMPEP_0113710482 /NCGR_PEP_ID=MMETSP0038_2-20120614/30182_1 /TAXON_ID=2898 /ORGANISM="Cryptomonas paramecium" /LENGTH=189 /DNA_ID=CAMNT_0000636545 /DNA_START=177 /DNA_END=742 /DNA_ORIENTATION=- /assembly_acc=CAM_ASM_000170
MNLQGTVMNFQSSEMNSQGTAMSLRGSPMHLQGTAMNLHGTPMKIQSVRDPNICIAPAQESCAFDQGITYNGGLEFRNTTMSLNYAPGQTRAGNDNGPCNFGTEPGLYVNSAPSIESAFNSYEGQMNVDNNYVDVPSEIEMSSINTSCTESSHYSSGPYPPIHPLRDQDDAQSSTWQDLCSFLQPLLPA